MPESPKKPCIVGNSLASTNGCYNEYIVVLTINGLNWLAGKEEMEMMSSDSISVRNGIGTWGKSELGTATGLNTAVILAGRALFSMLFLMSARGHFSPHTIAYAASQGVPLAPIAVPISGVLALAGGLSILLGYRARLGAWLIVLFLVPVTLMMHKFWTVGDPIMAQLQQIMFFKNMTMLGAALLISQFGTGPASLDAYRKR